MLTVLSWPRSLAECKTLKLLLEEGPVISLLFLMLLEEGPVISLLFFMLLEEGPVISLLFLMLLDEGPVISLLFLKTKNFLYLCLNN